MKSAPARVIPPKTPYDSYFKFLCEFCASSHTIIMRNQSLPKSVLCSVCHKESLLSSHKNRQTRRHEVNHEALVYDYISRSEHQAWVLDASPKGARLKLNFSPKSQQIYKLIAESFTAVFEARWVQKKVIGYEAGVEFHEFWASQRQSLMKGSIE